MGQIVDLELYRRQQRARQGLKAWRNRFGWDFVLDTRLLDIPDRILISQASPGLRSTMAFYELIMGLLGYPPGLTFEELGRRDQSQVLDIHLFMADNFRFEVMYRLGWLERFAARRFTLLEMVLDFQRARRLALGDPPALASSHPGYGQYRRLVLLDRQVMIRKLIPKAIEAFQRQIN